jgi:hypothetical protein
MAVIPHKICLTESFSKQLERLAPQEKAQLDTVLCLLARTPEAGERCRGDLLDVWIYSYNFQGYSYLLAYTYSDVEVIMLALRAEVTLST